LEPEKWGMAKPADILLSQPFPEERKAVQKIFKVPMTPDNLQVAARCRFIWLGVKPFQAREVLKEIGPSVRRDARVISFMAGVSIPFLRHFLGKGPRVIRLMPNTPCLLGAGMTGVFFPKDIDAASRKAVLKILENLGETQIFSREKDLDGVTGLSGSGPAFVYLLAQGLIRGGVRSGLSPAQARNLALQTLIGASRMLLESGKTPDELIRQVATPRGTTEAGLKVLAAKGVEKILEETVQRAAHRAREILEENDRCLP
jgi:pyrroline-5-carboxylate reductase